MKKFISYLFLIFTIMVMFAGVYYVVERNARSDEAQASESQKNKITLPHEPATETPEASGKDSVYSGKVVFITPTEYPTATPVFNQY